MTRRACARFFLWLSLISPAALVANPSATITSPTSGQVLSNVYQNGNGYLADASVTGSISGADTWTLSYSPAGQGQWQQFASGGAPYTTQLWHTIDPSTGINLGVGPWDLQLTAHDSSSGTSASATATSLAVQNFLGCMWYSTGHDCSQGQSTSYYQLNPNLEPTQYPGIVFTSVIPTLDPSVYPITETIYVQDASHVTRWQTVQSRSAAGIYYDTWDGKNLPDGPYFYYVQLAGGTYSMTWNLDSCQIGGQVGGCNFESTWPIDYFNNNPTHLYLGNPLTCFITVYGCDTLAGCPDSYYIITHQYHAQGDADGMFWPGVDSTTDEIRTDLNDLDGTCDWIGFARNTVVLYYTGGVFGDPSANPRLPLSVVPAVFSPAYQTQAISTPVRWHGSADVMNLTLTYKNASSHQIVRTDSWTCGSIGPPLSPCNTVSWSWDGRVSPGGQLVAPGMYILTLTGTDSLDNHPSIQAISTVAY